ncbi:MAG: helix-hairpin-helix domain-containing protein [Deltaproteobacteria bacterium]|nr:helix-hairpin-helix domain-containing protein [Deltaproteobacteria bacterium]
MLNRKFFTAFLVVILIGLTSVITVTAGDSKKININTATTEELMLLKGIGPKYAARIIEYREKYGQFNTPEGLMQVSGIGQKTFEKNQKIIIVEESPNN